MFRSEPTKERKKVEKIDPNVARMAEEFKYFSVAIDANEMPACEAPKEVAAEG